MITGFQRVRELLVAALFYLRLDAERAATFDRAAGELLRRLLWREPDET